MGHANCTTQRELTSDQYRLSNAVTNRMTNPIEIGNLRTDYPGLGKGPA